MMKKSIQTLIFFIAVIFASICSQAQVGVGIPSSSVHPSAQLEVSSTSKGFLPPRLTESQRAAIVNPSVGLMVYQTDASFGYWYFDGTTWVKLMVPSVNNTIPAGSSSGQILQWNGTQWITTSVCEALSFLKTDVNNCGTCGNVCSFPNATASCSSGQCTIASCNTGFANCNTTLADGCEINLTNNTSNCGTCGNVCNIPNASANCSSGVCTLAFCNAGFADCNSTTADGCEANLNTGVSNCGACGTVCPSGLSCVNGVCTLVCPPGQTNCGGVCRNLATDFNNCGACGNVCSFPNASGLCSSGQCTIAYCNTGFGNCNQSFGDGCETNLLSSLNNCGSCGKVCSIANATATCVSGSCAIASCNAGFGNCDGLTSNGCEVYLLINTSNCGSCGTVCPSGKACVAGSCQL